MKITTKHGDSGTSTLSSGKRIPKNDIRFNAIGDFDELNSYLGLIKAMLADINDKQFIESIQKNIVLISAHLYNMQNSDYLIQEAETAKLESKIEEYSDGYNWNKFTLTGLNVLSAHIDICRTIARRCERSVTTIAEQYPVSDETKRYINRLSDYLYMEARRNEPGGERHINA